MLEERVDFSGNRVIRRERDLLIILRPEKLGDADGILIFVSWAYGFYRKEFYATHHIIFTHEDCRH